MLGLSVYTSMIIFILLITMLGLKEMRCEENSSGYSDTEEDSESSEESGSGFYVQHKNEEKREKDHNTFGAHCVKCRPKVSGTEESEPLRDLKINIIPTSVKEKPRLDFHFYWSLPPDVRNDSVVGFELAVTHPNESDDCISLPVRKSSQLTNDTIFMYSYRVKRVQNIEDFLVGVRHRHKTCTSINWTMFPKIKLPSECGGNPYNCSLNITIEHPYELSSHNSHPKHKPTYKPTNPPNVKAVDAVVVTSLVIVVFAIASIVMACLMTRKIRCKGYADAPLISPGVSQHSIADMHYSSLVNNGQVVAV